MRKFILLSIAVGCFGLAQAQGVTKTVGSNMSYQDAESAGNDTLNCKGYLNSPNTTKNQDVNSILEAELTAVKIFPTQTSSELQLTNLKNTDVAIYSLVGQQMVKYSGLSGNTSIDVSDFASGIYFVQIQNGGAVRTEKIKIVR